VLLAAIDSILEQFAIWDADDRLLLANEKFREVYIKLLPATTMQERSLRTLSVPVLPNM